MALTLGYHFKEKFGVESESIAAAGAFDPLLSKDTPLFVDPLLLEQSLVPELKGARNKTLKYFEEVLHLLRASEKSGDLFWKQAERRLTFKEIATYGLGYSASGTSGSGIGPSLRQQLLETASALIKKGIEDPILFELVGIFEPNLGCDRISDMLCHILLLDFLKYTARTLTGIGIPLKHTLSLSGEKVPIFPHPVHKKLPVLLVPVDVLRDLPVANDWEDIGHVVAVNEEVRGYINKILGSDWQEQVKKFGKEQLKEVFFNHPDLLAEIIDQYKSAKGKPYDLRKDEQGLVSWRDIAVDAATASPLALEIKKPKSQNDVFQIAKQLVLHFQSLIENNGLWRNLYRDKKFERPFTEPYVQNIFYAISDYYCTVNNVDLSREPNAGSGPVDFKLSRGSKQKTLVEIKLSYNPRLVHAYEKQLPKYQTAERVHDAIVLVIRVADDTKYINQLKNAVEAHHKGNKVGPLVVIVDGLEKTSASRI